MKRITAILLSLALMAILLPAALAEDGVNYVDRFTL